MFYELNSVCQTKPQTKEIKSDSMYVTFDRFKLYLADNITNNWTKRAEQNTAFSKYIIILLSYVKRRLLCVVFGTQGLNTLGSNVSISLLYHTDVCWQVVLGWNPNAIYFSPKYIVITIRQHSSGILSRILKSMFLMEMPRCDSVQSKICFWISHLQNGF